VSHGMQGGCDIAARERNVADMIRPDSWCQPRWETQSTAYKDCDSTLGVWNDPPQLMAPAGGPRLSVGRGRVHLLEDASITGLAPLFDGWRGKRVACLMDEPAVLNDGTLFSVAGLLPRYLFQAGIPCCRISPSEQSGFVDENRLFYWPVSTSSADVIVWIRVAEEPISTQMRALICRLPLRRFVGEGGELYLGGTARAYLPYLADEAEVQNTWVGVQHLALYGDPCVAGVISNALARLELLSATGMPLSPNHFAETHAQSGFSVRAEYGDGLVLESRLSFVERNCLALEWRVCNDGRTPQHLAVSATGNFALCDREPVRITAAGAAMAVDLSARLQMPGAVHLDWQMAGGLHLESRDQAYRVCSAPLHLQPDAEACGRMLLGLSLARDTTAPLAPVIQPGSDATAWPSHRGAEQRWEKLVAAVPVDAAMPFSREVACKAVSTIMGNTWQAPPGLEHKLFGQRRIVQVQRLFYPLWAPYEAGFYASGVRHLDPALARDQLTLIHAVQHPDGWIPLVVDNDQPMEFNRLSQMPVLAFATWQTYRTAPDRDFLEVMYEPLARNIEWWYVHRQPRGDGAFGFRHAQEGAGDDHPRADETSGALRSGMCRFLSPDACGFVLMELRCLANIAGALGRTDDLARWRSRIAALDQRTREVCYDPADNLFYDVEMATGQFRRNVSPWYFIPLWAGCALEPAWAQAMIQRHLLAKLLDPVPFPIVPREDPAYLPDVYWRGPSWPQLWLIMLQTLSWYGFRAEADEAADRLVAMCHRDPYLMEFYDSQSGQGQSLPCYSFAAATLLEIVSRRYREAAPWALEGAATG